MVSSEARWIRKESEDHDGSSQIVNRGTMLGHEASTFSFKVLGHEVLPLGVK